MVDTIVIETNGKIEETMMRLWIMLAADNSSKCGYARLTNTSEVLALTERIYIRGSSGQVHQSINAMFHKIFSMFHNTKNEKQTHTRFIGKMMTAYYFTLVCGKKQKFKKCLSLSTVPPLLGTTKNDHNNKPVIHKLFDFLKTPQTLLIKKWGFIAVNRNQSAEL